MIINHTRFLPLLLVGLVLFGVAPAYTSTFQTGDNVNISPLHEIDDDFYAFSNQIIVDGVITGDLVGFGSQATIKGNIGRSANLACRYVDHSGSIEGSLRFVGERLTVNGRVGGSLVGAGASIMVRQGSVIEKDVDISAGEINLDGTILGRAECYGETVRITGQVGGDLQVEADKIVIAPPAVIRGNFTYNTDSEDRLTLEPGVTIIGSTTWQEPEVAEEDDSGGLPEVAYAIANLLAAFIFGIIVIHLFRAHAEESFQQLRSRVSVSVAAGLLALLGLMLAIVVLLLSLGGTVVGGILLSGDLAFLGVCLLVLSILAIPISSFVTVTGAVIFYSGKIIVGLVLGHLILKLVRPQSSRLSKSALFIGLIVLSIATALPYVGLVLCLLTALVGAGAIVLGINICRRGEQPALTAGVSGQVERGK